MSLSKISRSIVVVLFVVMIIFFSFIDVKAMKAGSEVTSIVTSNVAKVCYAIILLVLVLIYMCIKSKLYKLKVKRKISLIYRYIYLVIILIGTSVLVIYDDINDFSLKSLLVYIVISIFTGFVVKRIIFNVSKSDMLSVLGMFLYSMLPNVIDNKGVMFNSMFLEFTVLLTIYIIQKLIDELKQKGMKTKKYIKLACILGVLISVTSVLGVDIKVWLIVAILSVFITSNLDRLCITFSKRKTSTTVKNKKKRVLKMEKISINKLIIALAVIMLLVALLYNILSFALNKINGVQVIENLKVIKSLKDYDKSFTNLKAYVTSFVSFSRTYYMVLFCYILFMEFLAVILKRKYDTKSTLLKLVFTLLFVSMSLLHINICYYQPLFSTMLVLIAIVNTTNIYYNREERIKLLTS